MLKLLPRKIIQYTPEQLWNILTGEFILVMDDGEITTNYKEVMFSVYCWEIHKRFPNLPFYKRHLVSSVMKNNALENLSHVNLLSNIHKDLIEVYNIQDPKEIWNSYQLPQLYYEITNNIYNGFISHVSEYVSGMDILDFIEVYEHKDIKAVNENLQPTNESISNSYKVIMDVINKSESLKNNNLVRSAKSGLVRSNNLKQCIGPRGKLNDIDGSIFPNPIMKGYLAGMTTLLDSFMESRSASRALFFSKGQLEDAEYFARRLQLQTMIVERVHVGDCGSKKYIHWTIRNEKDLRLMTGVYYLDETSNELKYIKIEDKHLIGNTLKIRSPIAGCNHPDPHGVCSVCTGRLYLNTLGDTNLGHNSATTMTKDASQAVISTKHFEESSTGLDVEFSAKVQEFIYNKPKSLNIYFKPFKYHSVFNLIINSNEGKGILDILNIDNLDELNYPRLTNLNAISIEYDTNIEIINYPINLIQTNRKPFLTKEFAEYIKAKKWTVNSKDEFVIDCRDWDKNLPFIRYPMKHYNMGEHSRNIAALIESTVANIEERIKSDSAIELLSELFDLVNEKLNVHFSVLGIIVYGAMIRSLENHDYRLPKSYTTKSLSVTSLNIANRSMSAELAYENQFDSIKNPVSYFKSHRPNHVMDFFITPYEVSRYYGW